MELANTDPTYGQRLLHRWFVQYNPFYLVSATLCLAGLRLTSRGLAERGSVFGDLGVAAITELYALALIAGAALLTRVGQRRPGVMLALLAAVYQADVALHTEDCTYLGFAGIVAAGVWLMVFVAKLYALAWALKLRVPRSLFAVVVYGAAGLAMIPQCISRMHTYATSVLVSLWVFSLGALAVEASHAVESTVELDDWGRTVLRRSTRFVALLWALAVVLHVYFWSMTFPVDPFVLVPVAVFLGARTLRGEARVWVAVSVGLATTAVVAPHQFSLAATMATATLALCARRHFRLVIVIPSPPPSTPFRAEQGNVAAVPKPGWLLAHTPASAARRLLAGALLTAYLAAWRAPWPLHIVWLEVLLTAPVLYLAVRHRVRIALVPLAVGYAHSLLFTRVVTAPDTTLEWGAMLTASAFALLLASLATSYRLRNVTAVGGYPTG